MKHTILTLLAGLLVLVMFTTCSEEYLDIKPQGVVTIGSFYTQEEHADNAVTAIYSTFLHVAAWDRDLLMACGDISSDDTEAGGEYVNETPDFENFNRLTPLNTDRQLENSYGAPFRGIYFANLAIEKIEGIPETDPDADLAKLDQRVGEAKFLRGLNYFYLTMVFGGVPKVDHVLAASEYYQPRASIKEIYEMIELDLLEAIDVLPERSQLNASDIGRATKGAAKALLSRLYLFESSYATNYPGDERFAGMEVRWEEALDYAEQVIESGEYRLVGIDGETYNTWRGNVDGFRYIFTSDGDNSEEAVFEIQCISEGLPYGEARGSSYANWTAARRFVDTAGNYRDTQYWGLNIPNQNLVDAFEDGDPRYETTIAAEGEGDTIEIAQGERHPISFDKCVTGYYCRKYETSGAENLDVAAGGVWHGSPLNVKLFRYAEVYLNAAEAAFMLNDEETALEYINMVRTRARMCGTTGVPANLTSITFDQIVNERRVELAVEGHRFFDLVRWDLAVTYLTGTTHDGYPIAFESPKNDFFPLPQDEINASKGTLEQNPGW